MKSVKFNCVMHTFLHQTITQEQASLKNINHDLLASFLELKILAKERGIMPNLKTEVQGHTAHLSFQSSTCRNNHKNTYYQSSVVFHTECLKNRLAADRGSMRVK